MPPLSGAQKKKHREINNNVVKVRKISVFFAYARDEIDTFIKFV